MAAWGCGVSGVPWVWLLGCLGLWGLWGPPGDGCRAAWGCGGDGAPTCCVGLAWPELLVPRVRLHLKAQIHSEAVALALRCLECHPSHDQCGSACAPGLWTSVFRSVRWVRTGSRPIGPDGAELREKMASWGEVRVRANVGRCSSQVPRPVLFSSFTWTPMRFGVVLWPPHRGQCTWDSARVFPD